MTASLLLMTVPTSCSDYLDKEPDTELDLSMVFTNRDKVYQMLAYSYSIIDNPDKYRLIDYGYEGFADDLTASKRWQQWNWGDVLPKILASGQLIQNGVAIYGSVLHSVFVRPIYCAMVLSLCQNRISQQPRLRT